MVVDRGSGHQWDDGSALLRRDHVHHHLLISGRHRRVTLRRVRYRKVRGHGHRGEERLTRSRSDLHLREVGPGHCHRNLPAQQHTILLKHSR